MAELLTAKPGGDKICRCLKWHRPEPVILHGHHVWPLGEGGPNITENLLWVCPTSHYAIHELWRLMVKYGGEVPPWMRRPFTRYVREIVQRGWEQKNATRSP